MLLAMQRVANRVVKLLPVRSFVSFRNVVAIQVWQTRVKLWHGTRD